MAPTSSWRPALLVLLVLLAGAPVPGAELDDVSRASPLGMDLLLPYPARQQVQPSRRAASQAQQAASTSAAPPAVPPLSVLQPLPATPLLADGELQWVHTSRVTIYGQAVATVTSVLDPLRTLSVVEPGGSGGCAAWRRVQPTQTAARLPYTCHAVTNAGFFHVWSGQCIGNLVSNGRRVQTASSDERNVNIGITADGHLITGYLDSLQVAGADLSAQHRHRRRGDKSGAPTPAPTPAPTSSTSAPTATPTTPAPAPIHFEQLVAGVLWLVRDGQNYVNESIALEYQGAEETGTLQEFADVVAARTAIGYDRRGMIKIVQVDGKTHTRGVTLHMLADYLIHELDLVSAINLDGGGSSVTLQDGRLVSHPSDECTLSDCACPSFFTTLDSADCTDVCPRFNCERAVSTILCAHSPLCNAGSGCGDHGDCVNGSCICRPGWDGPSCATALCNLGAGCGPNGRCEAGVCRCEPAWDGPACAMPLCNNGTGCGQHGACNASGLCVCDSGWQGARCSDHRCNADMGCSGHGVCTVGNGTCRCDSGFYGVACELPVPIEDPPPSNAAWVTGEEGRGLFTSLFNLPLPRSCSSLRIDWTCRVCAGGGGGLGQHCAQHLAGVHATGAAALVFREGASCPQVL